MKHIKTSVGNSRGNSKLERRHRNINKGLIAALIQHCQDKKGNTTKGSWPQYLPAILFMLRNRRPTPESYSPSEIQTGRQLPFPLELKQTDCEVSRDLRVVVENAEEFFEKLDQLRTIAAEDNLEHRMLSADRKTAHQPQHYEVGDAVWLNAKHDIDGHKTHNKLDSDWIGPYVIISLKPPNAYILQHLRTARETNPIHYRFIRRAYLKPEQHQDDDKDDQQDSDVTQSESLSNDSEDIEEPESAPQRPKRNRKPVYKPFFIKQ